MISTAALAVIVLAVFFKVAVGGERPVAETPSNHHQPNRNPQALERVAAPAPRREPRLVVEPEPEPASVLASREREWDQYARPTCLRRGNVGLARAA